jgi:hypothetical protein
MDTANVIAVVAAGIAIVAIVPAVLSWRAAREQTGLARNAANDAAAEAKTAKEHAEAAGRTAAAAESQAKAAHHHAAAQIAALLFEIDRALRDFEDVHAALRPGGPGWFGPGDERLREKWIPVERYMGTFERVQALMEIGLVEAGLIEELYGYRIGNLVADPVVYRHKLVENANGWRRFIELWRALDAASRKRTNRPLAQRDPPQRVA